MNKQIKQLMILLTKTHRGCNRNQFYRNSFNQVIAELERQYDIKIKSDGVDTTKLFTGSFTHSNQKIAWKQ
jgi:hypothetical protein